MQHKLNQMNYKEITTTMVINAWNAEIKYTNATLDKISDEQLMQEITPGRNRGIYLLGHLVAVHDLMLPLLRFDDIQHKDYRKIFIESPDKVVSELPSADVLRKQWHEINNKLQSYIDSLPAEEWFTRHSSVSEEDFVKEPHRNRLNILLSRTAHLSNHRGQIVLLTPKA